MPGRAHTGICYGRRISRRRIREEFEERTVVPTGLPDLAFNLLLPRGCEVRTSADEDTLSFEELTLLAGVKLPGCEPMTVSATRIPFEVDLSDWLELASAAAGYQIVESDSATTGQGQTVHAVAKADGCEMRMFLANNGPAVVWLTATVSASARKDLHEVIGAVASSFEFVRPSGSATLEPVIRYKDPAGRFSVGHPASWTACPVEPVAGTSGLNLQLLDEAGPTAHIHCEASTLHPTDDAGAHAFLNALFERASDAGVIIGSLDPGEDGRLEGEYEANGISGPCLIALRPAGKTWLAVMALSPAPEPDAWPWPWLRARRAFDIVASSLDTPPGDGNRG